jgi:tripeptidyl-peptidase-2
MSSPNCCGCIALILSGLKHQNVEVNPYAVKRAIENTANPIEELNGGGAGLIQVEKAFDYLIAYKDSLVQKLHFDVKYNVKSISFKGIYLKNHDEVNDTRDYQIVVEPKFFENKSRSFMPREELEKNEDLLNGWFFI